MHPSTQRVADAIKARGLDVEILEFSETTRTAEDAAQAIGCQVGQIVKSLLFLVDDQPVMTLVSGANRLDANRLAALRGASRKAVRRADADTVKAITGFSIGGVPPFGHQTLLPVYVDQDLTHYELVWAAAGTPYAVFAIAPGELVDASQGQVVALRAE